MQAMKEALHTALLAELSNMLCIVHNSMTLFDMVCRSGWQHILTVYANTTTGFASCMRYMDK